jgi:hypothetical protein
MQSSKRFRVFSNSGPEIFWKLPESKKQQANRDFPSPLSEKRTPSGFVCHLSLNPSISRS